jgi:hypothetical protein
MSTFDGELASGQGDVLTRLALSDWSARVDDHRNSDVHDIFANRVTVNLADSAEFA